MRVNCSPYASIRCVMRRRSRTLISTAMAYGPAVFWIVLALWKFGPTRGFVPVLPLALMVGIGVFGLCGVLLAWFPWTMERLGFERFATWLRTWWDEDAR